MPGGDWTNRKIVAVCVLCAMLATAFGASRPAGAENVTEATMEVSLDTANHRLTITIVSDVAWDTGKNFTIVPKRVILEQVEGTANYHAAIESKVVSIEKLEVYKVIPNHEQGADGVYARFHCNQTGIQATFLDSYTAQLGPFDVDLGNVTGGTIPLDIDPILIDPW